MKFNVEFRNMAKIDKKILKALFIGVYTLKRIRETNDISTIDRGVLQLTKGNFMSFFFKF